MSRERALLAPTAEELFEGAPCGHLSTRLDGTILRVNRTFEAWTGLKRDELVHERRFQDLLSPGGRIYYETHYSPLLLMQGSVRAIAVEIVCASGSRLPALVNAELHRDEDGHPVEIWTSVFDATERRAYEGELLRARQHEHEVGLLLQRSLLSGKLPSADGLELSVHYRPAESGMEVGGDWYDSFWVDDVTIALVVGDVVGHGVDAAATMGQLRSAVRGLVSTGLTPAPLLERLDEYAWRHGVGQMCTLIYAELNLPARTLRFAAAGHPPPLIALPGEEPHFAWGGRSTPLAAYGYEAIRDHVTEPLPSGATVLLYTDGLIEQRSRPLDDGMDHLIRAVAADRSPTVAGMLTRLSRELPDSRHGDDVCAIAARLAPA